MAQSNPAAGTDTGLPVPSSMERRQQKDFEEICAWIEAEGPNELHAMASRIALLVGHDDVKNVDFFRSFAEKLHLLADARGAAGIRDRVSE